MHISYLVQKLLLRDLDELHLPAIAVAIVGQVVAGQLSQDEEEQLIVVTLVG